MAASPAGAAASSAAALVVYGVLVLAVAAPFASAWNYDGHAIICNLARPLLTAAAAAKVDSLLNSEFPHNFSTLCTWGDEFQYLPQYSWSPPLHFINTPDKACTYDYTRDCRGMFGQPNMCASGAINNYTTQLITPSDTHNKTEAMLFLANIMGDIHQPLRVGFAGDEGGDTIRVYWLNTMNGSSTSLFEVWDSVIIHETEERYFNKSTPTFNETLTDILGNMSLAIYANLTTADVALWGPCPGGAKSCPDLYATESIELACKWAYADVTPSQILLDDYYYSRLTIIETRLKQAAVRIATTFNRIFDPNYIEVPAPPTPTPVTPPAPAVGPIPPVAPVPGPTLPPVSPVMPVPVPPVAPIPPVPVAPAAPTIP
ncbi:hypothetical protein AXG93_1544s1240 [Marchantia polymorpha subsp. ruderalis]|uniref:Aspergillus nuclease S1 n=1 Tax=Marchantia polymorpha subsp. ruderalis TaxID=1480154 RepID=A0A176VQA3_MARPO|nr:hypothetical protein AXG93_1544s1240 [Marchantia polymorpha subsp. ruderalis]